MRTVRGVLKIVAILLVVVVAVVGALAADLTLRGFPQTSGTVRIPGLHAPVTVTRDRHGVVQITAEDPHDLFVAQGYVHAQERMWQMEVNRRIGAGRLAELFGPSQVRTDRYIRTLGWRAAAARDLEVLDPRTVEAIVAYADGVNAWIEQHDGRLPAAFVIGGLLSGQGDLGGYELEPWTPLDTATWQKVQAWSLGGNVGTEIFRFLADARLGDPALVDELIRPYRADAPIITPSGLPGSGGAGVSPASLAVRGLAAAGPASESTSLPRGSTGISAAGLAALGRLGASVVAAAGFDAGEALVGDHGVGSNNWVVSGAQTLSGSPILANDPHLGLAMPSIWFVNGLHCRAVGEACPWDVVGVSFPGVPAVVLGHNARIAWGATNVGPDTQDLFLETVDPTDPGRYLFGGESRPFEVRRETIRVAGDADVEIEVRTTHHGPILSDVEPGLREGPPIALSWAALQGPDRTLDAFMAINVAADFDDFRAALEAFVSPSQNFVYADVEGHIGYVLPGRIPVRAVGAPTGDRVRDGASGDSEWIGWVPIADLPWQLDPPSGRIVTANNAPVDEAYPYWLGGVAEWDPGYRAERIEGLLAERLAAAPLTPEVMRQIQMDPHVARADSIVPGILDLQPAPETGDGRAVREALAGWDRRCDVDSTGCAAYATVELFLLRGLFEDELGPLARDYVGQPPSWVALADFLRQPDGHWWDDTTTADELETAGTIVARAMDAAGAGLRGVLGDPADWRWGRLHRVAFAESTLGASGIGPLAWYFNAGPRAVSGSDGVVNNTVYRLDRAFADPYNERYVPVGIDRVFEVVHGPSVRFATDMADLDGARVIITTGQSGNPFDAHYGDLIDSWVAGESVPLPFSEHAVVEAAVASLTFTP